ncbi:CREB-binding protein [Caerostris extrusa]|uniref:histone acetyltransferase n=1 Tax=Caerostris extrusa TaxID=172846 RepID=A0AAV4NB64_CAEEX|nr:CREB-binding protein [Caerostris extrusa]
MQNSNLEVAESTVEQNAVPCSESAVNNATTVAITNSAPAPTVDQEKLRLIQKQLVLLLHAYACRRKDCQSGWASTLCSLPNCATMKHVPSHMKVCKIGKQCTLPHCAYSSQKISHWRNCTANDCPVCVPLQEAAATVQVTQSNQELGLVDTQRTCAEPGFQLGTSNDGIGMNNIVHADPLMSDQVVHSCSLQNLNHIRAFQPGQQNIPQSPLQMESVLQNNAVSFPNSKASNVINENFPSKLAASSADLLSSPNQKNRIPNLITDNSVPVKDWPINMDIRHGMVQKMIQSMFPAVNSNMLKDHRLAGLVSLVEKVERDMYKNANSKQEYCRLLAEILLKMKKILKDKRQKDKEN